MKKSLIRRKRIQIAVFIVVLAAAFVLAEAQGYWMHAAVEAKLSDFMGGRQHDCHA